MTDDRTVSPIEMAGLVASRICHDLISPIGALENGFEILDDDDSPQMREFAFDLIRKSARQASASIQMARLAMGGAPALSGGEEIFDSKNAHDVCQLYFADSKTELDWRFPERELTRSQMKLLLNLVCVLSQPAVRGGTLGVSGADRGQALDGLCVSVTGTLPLSGEIIDILSRPPVRPGDARLIQAHLCAGLARALGLRLHVGQTDGVVQVTTR